MGFSVDPISFVHSEAMVLTELSKNRLKSWTNKRKIKK